MRFNVEVRVSYRNREMPEDTALALVAVQVFVDLLPNASFSWYIDGANDLNTLAATRWATVLTSADRVAGEAATIGWTDPAEAEIEIIITPTAETPLDDPSGWAGHFSGKRRKPK